MYETIKELPKPTKWTIIATLFVIIVDIIDQSMVAQTWPAETIFLTISTIFQTPIGFIRDAIFMLLSVDKYPSFAGIISFVLNILYYYVWGCIIVYIIKLYKKRAIKK